MGASGSSRFPRRLLRPIDVPECRRRPRIVRGHLNALFESGRRFYILALLLQSQTAKPVKQMRFRVLLLSVIDVRREFIKTARIVKQDTELNGGDGGAWRRLLNSA